MADPRAREIEMADSFGANVIMAWSMQPHINLEVNCIYNLATAIVSTDFLQRE